MPASSILPVLAIAASLGASLGLFLASPHEAWALSAFGLVGLILFGRTYPSARLPLVSMAVAGALAAGSAGALQHAQNLSLLEDDYLQRWQLHAEVTQGCRPGYTPCSLEAEVFERRVLDDEGAALAPTARHRVRIYLQEGAWIPHTGDRFLASGRYRPSYEAIHPYTFDAAAWNARAGISAGFYLSEAPALTGAQDSWRRSVDRRRVSAELAMASMGHEEAVGILIAMLTGTKSGLSEEVRTRFAASGIAHVLAVSGMHLSLMTAALYFIVTRTLSRARWLLMRWNLHAICAAICIPIIILYVFFTGAPASAVRAGIMAVAVLMPSAFQRRGSGLHALALAVLWMLCLDPLTIVDVGFQLSVVATLSLVLLARESARVQRSTRAAEEEFRALEALEDDANEEATSRHSPHAGAMDGALQETLVPTNHLAAVSQADQDPWWLQAARWVGVSIQISVVSTLATAPFLVWSFGGVPWASPLPNLIVVPPLSVIAMPASAIGAFTMPVMPWLARPCMWVAIWTTEACLWICRLGAPLFEQELVIGRPHLIGVVGWALVAVASPWLNRSRRAAWVALLIGCALVGVDAKERAPRPGVIEIHAIPIGQGDATWIRLPDGPSLLIDAGGVGIGNSKTGARYVVPYLRAHGVKRVDWLVGTHGDADHVMGIIELVPVLRPTAVWVGGRDLDRYAQLQLYLAAKAEGVPFISAHEAWEELRVGDTKIVFLPSDRHDSSNDGSLAFVVEYRGFRALFTGDIEQEREAFLVDVARHHLDAHYLKVPHHGSRTSSTAPFLDAVAPAIAVVHAGKGNRYNLPREDVLERYHQREVLLWRTDRGAAIVHGSDGERVWLIRRHRWLR